MGGLSSEGLALHHGHLLLLSPVVLALWCILELCKLLHRGVRVSLRLHCLINLAGTEITGVDPGLTLTEDRHKRSVTTPCIRGWAWMML